MAKPAQPKPAAGKGRRSVPWDKDPEILARLGDVEARMLQGKSNRKIAGELGVTEATIRRDVERISILMKSRAVDDIVLMRERSITICRLVQAEAWESWESLKKTANTSGDELSGQAKKELVKARSLSVVLDAERMVIDLQGTKKPVEQQVRMMGDSTPLDSMSSADLFKRAEKLRSLAEELKTKKDEPKADGLGG